MENIMFPSSLLKFSEPSKYTSGNIIIMFLLKQYSYLRKMSLRITELYTL